MGSGCGSNLDPQLSENRSNLAATTVTCPNGNQQALFGGGGATGQSDVVDIFDGGDSLERTIDSLSVARNKTRVGNQEIIDLVKHGVKSGVPSIPVSHVTLMFQKSDPQNSLILSP